MRILPLVCLGLPLAGCVLPPALVVASYAGDAVLAVTTEKTSTDHLLSMAEKRDCAMWRVVKGRPICQDWADGHGPYEKWRDPDGNQVATAGSDAGFTTGMATDSRLEVDRGQIAAAQRKQQKGGVLLAQAGGSSPIVTAADARRAMHIDDTAPLGPFNPAGVAPLPQSADTPPQPGTQPGASRNVIAAPLAPVPSQATDNTPTVDDGAPITQPVAPAAIAPPKQTVAKAAPTGSLGKPRDERDRYVLIGSYRQQDNAQRVVREHRDMKPVVQAVTVKNERYYRVVAGPYTAAQAAEIRSSLRHKSHIDAIVARDCDGKKSGGCIDIGG
jgi:hypothetical protein